jgi:predicted Zn finger-like uncharacterized protein
MQFSCESCKAQLQIADEKVRGKRLIVRCKRCGAKIAISDPALGAARPVARSPGTPAAPSSAPPRVYAPAAARPSAPPTRSVPARARESERDSDTESTRAMDSDMLQQALQASKADDPSLAPDGAAAAARAAGVGPARGAGATAWFAMLHGKQAGPMTSAELRARIDEGAVGPRTYLWRDGMEAWQRAKDLPELQGHFPQLPQASKSPPPIAPRRAPLGEFSTSSYVPVAAAPAAAVPERPKPSKPAAPAPGPPPRKEAKEPTADPLPFGDIVPKEEGTVRELFTPDALQTPADLANWAAAELEKKPAAPRPRVTPASSPRMFEGAAPTQSRVPFVLLAIAILAAAALALWFVFGGGWEAVRPSPQKSEQGKAPQPPSGSPAPAKHEPPPQKTEAKPKEMPEALATGLTADQVRRKLDDNKPALQGCIDEALRRDPNLRVGKIHIGTTIAPSGQVTQARIDKGTVEQSRLGACLRQVTKKIAFPAFSGDAFDVDIPIVVTAGE